MSPEEVYDDFALIIRRIDEARRNSDEQLTRLKAQFEALLEILTGRKILSPAHKRHFKRVADRAKTPGNKVKLRLYVDKYTVEGSEPIDCASLMHLCKGRCCTLTIYLSTQDVREGKLTWDLLDPYVLSKDPDGRCVHQNKDNGLCGAYEHRPATCRQFDCRKDPRIWKDFENKIPAPMTDILVKI